MSDSENPGQSPGQFPVRTPDSAPADGPTGDESGTESGTEQFPASAYEPTTPLYEPTTPYGASTQPAAYGNPYGTPQQTGGSSAAPAYFPLPADPPPTRARVAGWTWPLMAVLALLLGIGGGFLGGRLAEDDSSGGVLQVERRTAQPLPADNDSIAAVAEEVLPSTVQIIAAFKGKDLGAVGSGFVFDEQGHVITNNHVIEDAAKDDGPIDVVDSAGQHHKATVVGRSPVYDLAVLKVEGIEDLKPAALGSADQMRVGEMAIAVGSPLRYSASVTAGIISAKNRPVSTGDGDDASYINAIQTDAAINPGNSGGPLANLQGEVIGVNSALASLGAGSSDEAGNIGIGFAIPMEQVQITADQILRTGKAQYPVIGVAVGDIETQDGAKVRKIDSGTPADDSDLKIDDVITAVDGIGVSGVIDVIVAIRSHQVDDTVKLTVKRGGKELSIAVGLFGKTG